MSTITRVPEDDLIDTYQAAKRALYDATFPALLIEEVTADGETYMALRCPRCERLVNAESLCAVSPAESWDYAEDIDDDSFDHQRVYFSQDERPDLEETLYYLHNDNHAVSLPEGWTEDWT